MATMSRPPLNPRTSSSSYPRASIPRMILAPFIRLFRRLAPPGLPTSLPSLPSLSTTLQPSSSSSVPLILLITAALQRLDLSRDPRKTLHKLSRHHLTITNILTYTFFSIIALYCLYVMRLPILIRLAIPLLYVLAILLPITSQLIWPATPVLTWVILFFTARFIPSNHRPEIHVALLPALESVLYGANISDLQTRYTNPVMDIIAWLPYGVAHFSLPVIVALILWAVGPKAAAQYWGKAFGWMNLLGVMTQILFPCAAPWYEIIHGLTPADYSMPGSPGGLLRIDRVLHTSTYTNAFGAAPLVFGAFPSLHSGCAVMEALFMSHFFPRFKPFYWMYVGVLWWATMYLSHHYLIDLTAGACLSVIVFYVTMPTQFKDVDQIIWTREQGGVGAPVLYATTNGPIEPNGVASGSRSGDAGGSGSVPGSGSGSREEGGPSGLEGMEHREARPSQTFDQRLERLERDEEEDEREADEEAQIAASGSATGPKKPKRSVSWGETKVLGEERRHSPERNGEEG